MHDCDCGGHAEGAHTGCSGHAFEYAKERNKNKRVIKKIRELLRGKPDGMKPQQLVRHAMSIKFAPEQMAAGLLEGLIGGSDSFEFENGRWKLVDTEHTALDLVPFVIVDLETTGGRSSKNRIIEIGAFKVIGGSIRDSIMAKVNPGRRIPLQISHLTGIYDEHVEHSPKIEEIFPRFLDFLGDGVFVAHNARFDYSFINAELARCGHPPLENDLLCTLKLARRVFPGEHSYGLDHIIERLALDLDPNERHRGHGDAWVTAELLIRALPLLQDAGVNSLEELLRFQSLPVPKAKKMLICGTSPSE